MPHLIASDAATAPHPHPILPDATVGVLGAGAMGAGIAQVALARGHAVVLGDASEAALARARDGIAAALRRDVEKGRLPAGGDAAALARLTTTAHPALG